MPVTRAAALDELESIASDISSAHQQLAQLLAAEHEAKVTAWFATDSTYVSTRDRTADHNALSLTVEVIHLRGELAAFESRRAYLELLIQWSQSA